VGCASLSPAVDRDWIPGASGSSHLELASAVAWHQRANRMHHEVTASGLYSAKWGSGAKLVVSSTTFP
jgi:hypothetical protein